MVLSSQQKRKKIKKISSMDLTSASRTKRIGKYTATIEELKIQSDHREDFICRSIVALDSVAHCDNDGIKN